MSTELTVSCPIPSTPDSIVTLAHGGGGKLTNELIERLFIPTFANAALETRHDGAVFEAGGVRLAFTTDSYVVQPLFFAGGDIGSLAVHGTVNDLAMCGARPVALSAGLIIEEGFATEALARIAASMQVAARCAGVPIVTGDTKVVDRGKGDGIFINTAGIGVVEAPSSIDPAQIRPGDAIIVSGDVGRHGTAIMAERDGLSFESALQTDSASLWAPVQALLADGLDVHCLRDLTRGGLATALVEIAATAGGVGLTIDETAVPIGNEVRGACEILGLDPLYVANEGRCVCILPERQADRALGILREHDVTSGAARIGTVASSDPGLVVLRTSIGTRRIVDMLSGEQLPRIC